MNENDESMKFHAAKYGRLPFHGSLFFMYECLPQKIKNAYKATATIGIQLLLFMNSHVSLSKPNSYLWLCYIL